MATLTIHFRGLTALVRRGDSWRVVLPNVLRSRVSRLDPCCIIEEHYANIAVPEAAMDEASAKLATFYGRIHMMDPAGVENAGTMKTMNGMTGMADPLFTDAQYFGVFLAPHHRIEIGGVKSRRLEADLREIDPPNRPQGANATSLHWTADMPRIDSNFPKVKEAVLSDDPPIDLVSAYMDIGAGRVYSGSLNPNDVYHFINTSSGNGVSPSQRLSFEVLVELEVEKPTITLFDRRPDAEPREDVTICLNDAEKLTIVVDNAPLDEILGARHAVGNNVSDSGQPYYHFEVIYDLVENAKSIVLPVAPEFRPHLDPPFSRCVPPSMLKSA